MLFNVKISVFKKLHLSSFEKHPCITWSRILSSMPSPKHGACMIHYKEVQNKSSMFQIQINNHPQCHSKSHKCLGNLPQLNIISCFSNELSREFCLYLLLQYKSSNLFPIFSTLRQLHQDQNQLFRNFCMTVNRFMCLL